MTRKQQILYLSLLLAIVSVVAFSEKQLAIFVIPQGWPQPRYDFMKNPLSDEGFRLGRVLFYDPILSKDSSTSCSTCHIQFTAFTHGDHRVSHGINGLKGTRNPMVLFNLAWYNSFRWDGAANHIETQPIGPITNPIEMDNTLSNMIFKLQRSKRYSRLFYKAFGDTVVTLSKVMKSLSQFLLCLQSHNSKYDKVMRKEPGSWFDNQEERGYNIFKANCSSCHEEPLFTNQQFMDNGLSMDSVYKDLGRGAVTGLKKDSLCFRVPSLRNVAVSSPYMHDGRFNTLDEVLDHYSNGVIQRENTARSLYHGLKLNKDEKSDLVAFLNTLTDKTFLYELRYRYHVMD